MQKFDIKYDAYLMTAENGLRNYITSLQRANNPLIDAMRYSLLASGKRIRPVIMLAASDMLSVDKNKSLPFAVAIEMIHTYSLIHDDLPAMDNDDVRRGKPSCHIKFGEGQAILAGDGLLNQAYSLCFNSVYDEKSFKAAKIICDAAGAEGMISGQSSDLKCERAETYSENDLLYIIENKTAKLLCAPLTAASALAGGLYMQELQKYGTALGYLFQITDDILDIEGNSEAMGKTLGKDEKNDKFTSVKFYGLDGAKRYAKNYYEYAKGILSKIQKSEFLSQLTDKVYKRTH